MFNNEKVNRVILISGKLQSGKNQFAEYLKETFEQHGKLVRCDLFAKGVKDGAKEDFKLLCDYLNTLDIPELKTTEENFYEEKTELTRILLQLYGTEIFRNRVDKNHWVKQLIYRAKENSEYVSLVTDVRFQNEISLLKQDPDLYVCTVRINRTVNRIGVENEHPSETSLDTYSDWDFHITNNGTLEDLREDAEKMYARLQKIQIYGRCW